MAMGAGKGMGGRRRRHVSANRQRCLAEITATADAASGATNHHASNNGGYIPLMFAKV
jgi:hypothetical protein